MANVFLKNTSTKWQSNLIDLTSALGILSLQNFEQAKNWQVYVDDGRDEWVNVLECSMILELFLPVQVVIQPTLKQPEPVQTSESTVAIELPQQFFDGTIPSVVDDVLAASETVLIQEEEVAVATPNEANITDEELKGAERRQHTRFDIRLRVIIKSGKNTYLTFTRDVSLGGLSLMNDVPEYIFNSEAEIYITAPDNKNNIMFTCSPIASKLGKSRLMFTRIEESKQKMLATWLQHFVKPNAKKVS